MTIDQMHIEIENGVQEMASKTQDRLEPEQYDLVINKMISRFVDMKLFPESDPLGKGFYIDQSRVNSIRTLIERDKVLPVHFEYNIIGSTYYSELPNNYRHLIKIKSDVEHDCIDIKIDRKTIPRILCVVNLPKQEEYKNLSIYFNNKKIVEYERTIRYKELYTAINYILNNSNSVYWESFGDYYESNSFIIVADNTFTANAYIRSDSKVIALSKQVYKHRYIPDYTVTGNPKQKIGKHELYSPEIFDDLNDDPYAMTSSDVPISTLINNRILTKTDDSFLLIATKIDYIRNPRSVDINLNINSDLPSNVHDEIVDMSVKYIVHAIENAQKFQLTMAEFFKK